MENEKIKDITQDISNYSPYHKLFVNGKSGILSFYDEELNLLSATIPYSGTLNTIKFAKEKDKMVVATSTNLYVIDITDPASPVTLSNISISISKMVYAEEYDTVLTFTGSKISAYSILDTANVYLLSTLDMGASGVGGMVLSKDQKTVYLSMFYNRFVTVDISNFFDMKVLSSIGADILGGMDVDHESGIAYVGSANTYGNNFYEYNISDPSSPSNLSTIIRLNGAMPDIKISDDKSMLLMAKKGTNGADAEMKIFLKDSSGNYNLGGFINTGSAEKNVQGSSNKYILTSTGTFDLVPKVRLQNGFSDHNITFGFSDLDNSELNISIDVNSSLLSLNQTFSNTVTNFNDLYNLTLISNGEESGVARIEVNATDGELIQSKYIDIIVEQKTYSYDLNITNVELNNTQLGKIELIGVDNNITIGGIATLQNGENQLSFELLEDNATYTLAVTLQNGLQQYYNFTDNNFYDSSSGSDFELTFNNSYVTKEVNLQNLLKSLLVSFNNTTKTIETVELVKEDNSTLAFDRVWSPNLVINGDAEDGINNWTISQGDLATQDYSVNNAGENKSITGTNYFTGGNVTPSSAYQEIDLSGLMSNSPFKFSVLQGGYNSNDTSEVVVTFIDSNNNDISSFTTGTYTSTKDMRVYELNGTIPSNTIKAKIVMQMLRTDGTQNSGYVDDITFQGIKVEDQYKYIAKDILYNENYAIKVTLNDDTTWWYNFTDGKFYDRYDEYFQIINHLNNEQSVDSNDQNWINLLPTIKLKAHGGVVQLDTNGSSSNVSFDMNITFTSFTIEWWMNPYEYVNNGNTLGADWDSFMFTDNVNGLYVGIDNNSNTDRLTPSDHNATFDYGSWQHFAFTFDGSSGTGTLYKNGLLKGSKSGMSLPATWSSFKLGGYTDINKYMVDELRIWNTIRTAQEISDNYKQQLDGNETGLVAYYNFDERVGDTIKDITGNEVMDMMVLLMEMSLDLIF